MITLAAAVPDDVPGITALLDELEVFYGGPGPDADTLRDRQHQVETALFGLTPTSYALVARDGGNLVGLATYSFLWPAAGLSGSIWLKELYVADAARGTGIGTALMRRLFAIAAESECSRVEWTTERGNEAAQAFYQKLGVAPEKDKIMYRIAGENLARAATPDDAAAYH